MEQGNIVILKAEEGRLSQLDGELGRHPCFCFYLPVQSELSAQLALFDQIKVLKPQAILLDIKSDYDYQSFLSFLTHSLEGQVPTLLGVIESQNDARATEMLTELPIDSFVFSHWSLERMIDKLDQLELLRVHNNELLHEIENTSRTALTAMRAASEVGLLMQMVEWLNDCHQVSDVANTLFRVCRSLELKAFCMVKDQEQLDFYPEGMVHETAQKILREAQFSQIRVLSKNRIVVFRLDYLVLMITNAPWEDDEKYGRIRDILLQAAALAEAKVRTISVNNLISEQHQQVQSIMSLIKNVSAETQMYARGIMRNLSTELHEAAMTLDLTEFQEQKLSSLSEEALDAIEVLYENSDALEHHFHSLIDSITKVQALTRIPEQSAPTANSAAETTPENNELGVGDEITLF